MARVKNQSARRDLLIASTLAVISELGLAKVTMKKVAEHAGISQRLVAYYYSDLDELIHAAHEVASQRYYDLRQQVVAGEGDAVGKLARLMHSGLPREGDLLLSQALNEMSVSAGRSPDHAASMNELFDREVSLYTAVLELGSTSGAFALTDPAAVIARNFVALEDALGLHLLARNPALSLTQAEEQLASHAFAATGVRVRPSAA